MGCIYFETPCNYMTYTMDGSMMVVGVLTHSVLLYSMSDLKAAHMNMQFGLT